MDTRKDHLPNSLTTRGSTQYDQDVVLKVNRQRASTSRRGQDRPRRLAVPAGTEWIGEDAGRSYGAPAIA